MSLDMASPAADNEKHLGSQNQDEQNLERHGYVQQTKYTRCWALPWLNWHQGWIASAGSAPFLAGTQIQGLLVLNYPDSYVFQRWHGTLLFWAVLLGSACICIFCSNKLPLIEKLTLVLHVTFFIAIIVTMAVTSPTKHSAEWVFSHFENNSGWGNDAVAWRLLSSCYVLIGYDGATHLSEEMNNAEMGVPRAMVGCLLVNGPLGFAFLLIILFFMGDISAALATPTGFPIIEIFLHMTGSVAAATTMTAMITVMACLSTVPLLTAAARIMWAFARDGGLPFAERIASVDKRRQIPTVSIVVVSFLLMLLSLINIGSTTAFNAILSLAVPITPVNMNYAPVVLGGALVFGCFYWPLRVSKRLFIWTAPGAVLLLSRQIDKRNPTSGFRLFAYLILDNLLILLTSYQGLAALHGSVYCFFGIDPKATEIEDLLNAAAEAEMR
uniref:Choline transport protein n=1 Tax=Fusarium oxysporum (strain Fo5176) TaxID=660025 RepID=A0A0D2YB26_FUSOF